MGCGHPALRTVFPVAHGSHGLLRLALLLVPVLGCSPRSTAPQKGHVADDTSSAPDTGHAEEESVLIDHGVVLASGLSRFVASDASVAVRDDGTLAMVYTDVDPETDSTVLMWTTSEVPGEWSPGTVLLRGQPGDWDEAVEAGALAPGGEAVLYGGYRRGGDPTDGFPADQGLLRWDGSAWVRSPAPVWTRQPGSFSCDAIYSVDVVGEPGDWQAVFAGHCYTDSTAPLGVFVGGAQGDTLETLTADAAPVLDSAALPPWATAYAAEPALTQLGPGCWALFFTGFPDWEGSPPAIGVATASQPGGPWSIRAEALIRADADWRAAWVGAPDALVLGGALHLYPTGVDTAGITRIGHVELTNPSASLCAP
jgi:hypothetical protein